MTTQTSSIRPRTRAALRFTGHYLEMVVAMILGMVALGPLWSLAWPELSGHSAPGAIVMATNMTVAMALWMRVRGHAWAPIAEMSVVMYAPFLALLVPYALGLVSGGTVMMAGHVIMFPLMLVAMLWRRHEYCH